MAINCIVVTPEETAFEKEAKFVVVPLFDGECGIDVRHSPMIGRLGYGELRITLPDDSVERYYVDGGFVQVADDTVSLMTGRIVAAADLDTAAAEAQLSEAKRKPGTTDELLQIREREIEQARAQLRLANK